MRMRKLTRSKKPADRNAYARVVKRLRGSTPRTAIVASICVLGAAMLLGAVASDKRPAQTTPKPPPARIALSSTAAASPTAASPKSDTGDVAPAETNLTVDVKAPAPKAAAVTLTGCLEKDDQTFRLKDTTGADAPKSRNWKSAFLKKSSATVHVVDASNRLKLPAYVGQRVSVTGTVVERDMQARSVKRVAASCDVKS